RRGAILARVVTMTVTRGDPEATPNRRSERQCFWFRGVAKFCHVQRSWSPSELVFPIEYQVSRSLDCTCRCMQACFNTAAIAAKIQIRPESLSPVALAKLHASLCT